MGLRPITKHNCKKGVPHGNFVEARLLLWSIQLTMFVEQDNWILERQTLSLSYTAALAGMVPLEENTVIWTGCCQQTEGRSMSSGPVTVGVDASEGS